MIVKIQRSIVTNHKRPQVLVYNKDRLIFWEGDLSKDVDEMMGERSKVYFDAKLEDSKVVINFEVEEQDW